jgi:hypothetical protein
MSEEEKKVTFETYAKTKKIPIRKWAGMKAYTIVIRATIEEWEAIFATY